MKGPIDTDILIITQPYKGNAHRGVDLRSVDLKTYKLLPVIITDPVIFVRQGIDGYGNDYAVFKTSDDLILKYIHVTFNQKFTDNQELRPCEHIGFTQVKQDIGRGNSAAHHLHFEVWKDDKPIDPVEYFYERHIKYGFK